MNKTAKEKRNHRIGGITSVIVHILFILIAFFLVTCWKSPGPPNRMQDIGVVLDFGTTETGSGELKSESEPNDIEETPEEITPETAETEAQPTVVEEAVVNDVESEVTTDQDSPVTNSDADVTPDPSPEPTPVVEPVKDPKPVTDPVPDPVPTTDPKNVMGTPDPNNNGDGDNTGDAGDKKSVDDRNVYSGNSGGGTDGEEGSEGDFNVQIGGGWKFNGQPKEDRITHSGSITFSFVVDEFGDITRITINQSSFTPNEEAMLREKIKKELTFRQTSGVRPPEETKGTLTWKFKAQ